MLDPMSAYRTSQVVSSSPAGQIVLLYQGAIRFGVQHLAWLERGEIERSHQASMRAQEIVGALRGSLDLTAGPVAIQLDELYDFVQRRLLAGNVAKKAKPTEEALQVLRGLLEAWQELATGPVGAPSTAPQPRPDATAGMAAMVGAGTYAVGGARR